MKHPALAAVLFIAPIGGALAANEIDVARPGATYATQPADTAEACDRLCRDDGLCMSWSFQDDLCEMKAVVAAPVPREGAASGVSSRAPLALITHATGEVRPMPFVSTAEQSSPLPSEENALSAALLGGQDTDAGLRIRHGN